SFGLQRAEESCVLHFLDGLNGHRTAFFGFCASFDQFGTERTCAFYKFCTGNFRVLTHLSAFENIGNCGAAHVPALHAGATALEHVSADCASGETSELRTCERAGVGAIKTHD